MSKVTIDVKAVSAKLGKVEGKTSDEIKGLLMSKCGVPFSKVAATYKALGFVVAKTGYAAEFYNKLRSKPMADDEFAAWIKTGSANVKRSEAHYNEIRLLANDIHAAK